MKIILCGSGGKMGKAIISELKNFEGFKIIAGIGRKEPPGESFPVFRLPEEVTLQADVIMDFSHPDNSKGLLKLAKTTHTPLVLGTTGFNKAQLEDIKNASKAIPVFHSGNMSLGINMILELSKIASKVLGDDFDAEIVEMHHNQKIDAPSGTALMLAGAISSCKKEPAEYTFDRSKKRTPRNKNEIGIHSIRGGTAAGTHDVIFAGSGEIVTLSHSAGSRDIFARGALKAAGFLVCQAAGLYSMKDLVGLKV